MTKKKAEIKRKAEAARGTKAVKAAEIKKRVETRKKVETDKRAGTAKNAKNSKRAKAAKKAGTEKRAETSRKAEIKKGAEPGKRVETSKKTGIRKGVEVKKPTEIARRAEIGGRSATRKPVLDASGQQAGGAIEVLDTTFEPDASVAVWVTAVAAVGGTVSADRVRLIDVLVKWLKDCGVWDRLDRLWVFAAENQAQALIDLVGLGRANAVNEPSFIADLGYAFDGSTQYIDTCFDAAAASAPRYSRNSASFGGAIFAGATNVGVEFGNDYSAYSMLITRYGRMRRFQINSATDSVQKIPHNEVFVGHFHGQRSAENLTELFLDGVLQGSSPEPSSRVPARTFLVGACRANVPNSYSNASISTAHVGGSFSPDQVVQFDTAIRSYLSIIAPPSSP